MQKLCWPAPGSATEEKLFRGASQRGYLLSRTLSRRVQVTRDCSCIRATSARLSSRGSFDSTGIYVGWRHGRASPQ
ncbi:hypothetical protein M514_20322 [Trichuris suis]|uniref:Uncharacterized protein n=1 Tax=Trichuris suis TaxID=68888 RepID=A0A085NDD5_9BILA|nr:hypothetical protein M514_20322 [Trichuris suis]